MEAELGMADMPFLLPVAIGPLKATIPFDKPTAWGGRDLPRAVGIRPVRAAMVICPGLFFAGHHPGLIATVAGAGH